jgi:hypothetical protein
MDQTKENLWVQIHTNGGTTTFARWRKYPDYTLNVIEFLFEKMQVDTSSRVGSVEIFGEQIFGTAAAAMARLDEAQALQR